MKYTINIEDLEKLEKKINSLKAKFKKNGHELTYYKLGEYFKEDSNGIIQKYMDIEVEGFSKIGDYSAIALIEHGDKANLIYLLSSNIELPEKFRTTKSYCDHCGVNRLRKQTVVLYNGNEFKQVGKSCLKDFLGIDVEMYALWAQLSEGLEQISLGNGCQYSTNYLDSETVLLLAIEETIEYGYLSRYTKIYNGPYEELVFNENNTSDKIIKFFREPNLKYQGEYNRLLDWLNETEQTEFIQNIKALITEGYVSEKKIGMLACIYKVMLKDIDKKALIEAKAFSQYVGQVGDKIEVTGNITQKGRFETKYGITSIYEIIENGNIFIWFTANSIEEGFITLKGTIKEHKEYNGVKQTILTRCKITDRIIIDKPITIKPDTNNDLKAFFEEVGII